MEDFAEFDVSAFLPHVAKRFCPQCGLAVFQSGKGRPKVFCSDECRITWNNRHPKPEHWSSSRQLICPVCGKSFLSPKEIYRPRKFCSRACANRGRVRKKNEIEHEKGSGA